MSKNASKGMKNFKKLFKTLFGKEEAGLNYVSSLAHKKKQPVTYFYGANSKDFVALLKKVVPNNVTIQVADLDKGTPVSGDLIFIEANEDLHPTQVQKIKQLFDANHNVVVCLPVRPKALDFIYDPLFAVTEVKDIDANTAVPEIPELQKNIGLA